MSSHGEPEIDVGELISEQLADFESIERHITAVDCLIRDKKSASVLISRNDYTKFLWTNCQGRNGQIYRLATKEEKTKLEYFSKKDYGNFEIKVFNCFDHIVETLSALQPMQQPLPAIQKPDLEFNNHNHVRLPRIDLANFSGDFTTWQAFRDSFISLVKNNQQLDDISKLHYHRSSLKGEALDQIGHIEIIDGNFEIAWDLLTKQYDNNISLVNAHVNAIFSIEPLNKESSLKLQSLRNSIQKHIGALKRLGRDTDGYDDILINRVESLLDPCTQRAWKFLIASKTEYPTYSDLDIFLTERIRAISSSTHAKQQNTQSVSQKSPKHASIKSHHTATVTETCIICHKAQSILKCQKFKECSPQERYELVKKYKLCINCLSAKHVLSQCACKFVCFKCPTPQKHHTWLHRETQKSDSIKPNQSSTSSCSPSSSGLQLVNQTHFSVVKPQAVYQIILATARVWVLAPNGRAVRFRALLDQGSTCSFVSRDLVLALGLKLFNVHTKMTGIAKSNVGTSSRSTEIRPSAHLNGESSITTHALVLPKITAYVPNCKLPMSHWSHLVNLDLADDPSNNDPIHLLIGANIYGMILLDGLKKGEIGGPIAQNTIFAWVVSGEVPQLNPLTNQTVSAHHCISNQALDSSLKPFWETEDIPLKPILSIDDELCEEHFRQTHTRKNDGRYVVRIPFKSPLPLVIGDSHHSQFKDLLARDRITWEFNPPAAPHFGGLWEAGVKSVKGHLKRILANKTPTLEELTTLLCQIEAALNSRPLGPLHDNTDNCEPLTPGHVLIGGNLIAIPQPSLSDINTNRLSRWSMMQQCFEIFWREWATDYLQSLQQRTKWRIAHANLRVGQLILLKQPNLPPTKWLLGRIEKCFPGHDGKVRVVQIKTAKSSFVRPVTEIALLPIDLEDSRHTMESTPQ